MEIDDISGQFSNSEADNTEFLSINEVDDISYETISLELLIVTTEIQLTDLTILSDGWNCHRWKWSYNSNTPYGGFDLLENEFDETF